MTAPAKPAAANPMRNIIIMVGTAIAIFLAFTSYSVHKSIQSSTQLSDVRDLYFPVLERSDAILNTLEKMQEGYLNAVMVGEASEAKQTFGLGDKIDQHFAEMEKLNPSRQKEIAKLRADAKSYNQQALGVSSDVIGKKGDNTAARTTAMNAFQVELSKNVKAFRESSYGRFVDALKATQDSVKTNLYMGIALGVMNLCFMGVLVYFIRNNMRMLSVIAEQNATLEHRVAERTAQLAQKTQDINAMLQNMKLGVCAVSSGNKIHPEFSAHMHVIFEADALADQNVLDAIFSKAKLGADVKDQISNALSSMVGEDEMMFDFNSHILPREVHADGGHGPDKVLQMDWSPIVNANGTVDKVLLIAQDITHLRELELASSKQREELDTISQIIKISIGKFNDFIASSKTFITENHGLILASTDKDPQTIAALFRNMHTIKGNSRTYQLQKITDAAHAAEQEYDRLRSHPDAEWNPAALLAGLHAVESALEHYVDVNENKLGRKGRASDMLTARGAFVSNSAISDLKNLADQLDPAASPHIDRIRAAIAQLGLVPFERLASGSIDSLSSLARELGKPEPRFEITHGEVAFNNKFAEALKGSLMHIVRNCMDHGIESPEQRAKNGKAAQGLVKFDCMPQSNGSIILRIRDDGRGLALERLRKKGISSGILSADEPTDPSQIAELIFHAGLSTADQVTQVSGRGVGMDAVKAFLGEQGAEISIILDEPNRFQEFAPFEFAIKVPASATQIS